MNGRADKPLAGNQAGLFPSRHRLYAPPLYAGGLVLGTMSCAAGLRLARGSVGEAVRATQPGACNIDRRSRRHSETKSVGCQSRQRRQKKAPRGRGRYRWRAFANRKII
jgi:hypothetical protein